MPLAGADANFFFGGAGISNDAYPSATVATWQPVRIAAGNLDPVDNLTVGTTVDGSSIFSTGFGGSGDPNPHLGVTFADGTPGYVGFSLETGGGTVYGWMRVTLVADVAGGTIHEWAYEDVPGAPIQVGAIPEPSVMLLSLTSLAFVFRRRR